MKHFISFHDLSLQQLQAIVERAREIKGGSAISALKNKQFVPFFFNPSLRTRVSFETACMRYGGHCTSLSPGSDTWKFEHRLGVRMDGACAEHLKEAVQVVSRYADCLAVRSFAGLRDITEDLREEVLRAFISYSTVPVVNLESAVEHPCQAISDMLTISEKAVVGAPKKFVVTWAPHIKPLPLAVPHSAILAGAARGMDVVIAYPEGYDLAPSYIDLAQRLAAESGGSVTQTQDQTAALRGASIVYVKSWGSPALYQQAEAQTESFNKHKSWMLTRDKLEDATLVMHCLPVRRNVVIADDVLDSSQAIIIDQAENRLWGQAAILEHVMS